MEQEVKYWIEIAEYDLDTAKAMLETKRYLYVGFMCHQSLEKLLKAIFVRKKKKRPPYIHSLKKLVEIAEVNRDLTPDQRQLINKIEPLNIMARYPDTKLILLKEFGKEKAQEIFQETKRFFQWLKEKYL